MTGQTHPVTLDMVFKCGGEHPLAPFIPAYAGACHVGFSDTGSLPRGDFGLGFASALDLR